MKNKTILVFNIKKVNRLLDGSCVRILGYDSSNGRLRDFVVPFFKVYVNEEISRGECMVTLNIINSIHRVDVSYEDIELFLSEPKKSFIKSILGGF